MSLLADPSDAYARLNAQEAALEAEHDLIGAWADALNKDLGYFGAHVGDPAHDEAYEINQAAWVQLDEAYDRNRAAYMWLDAERATLDALLREAGREPWDYCDTDGSDPA